MPLVNLRVDDATRQLWVDAANGEQLTLSEWIRKACDARLGLADRYIDRPLQTRIEEIASQPPSQTQTDQGAQATMRLAKELGAGEQTKPQVPAAKAAAKTAAPQEPQAPAPNKPFRGPDLKPETPKKKKRW